jgi:hypothetical protein
MKVEDFVFETFLRLTSKTVPYGSEDVLITADAAMVSFSFMFYYISKY